MNRHLAIIGLVGVGLALVLGRPSWMSVAVLVVLSALAALLLVWEMMEADGMARVGEAITDLRNRDDERAAALAKLSGSHDKQTADLKQMEERLQRLGGPVTKARL